MKTELNLIYRLIPVFNAYCLDIPQEDIERKYDSYENVYYSIDNQKIIPVICENFITNTWGYTDVIPIKIKLSISTKNPKKKGWKKLYWNGLQYKIIRKNNIYSSFYGYVRRRIRSMPDGNFYIKIEERK